MPFRRELDSRRNGCRSRTRGRCTTPLRTPIRPKTCESTVPFDQSKAGIEAHVHPAREPDQAEFAPSTDHDPTIDRSHRSSSTDRCLLTPARRAEIGSVRGLGRVRGGLSEFENGVRHFSSPLVLFPFAVSTTLSHRLVTRVTRQRRDAARCCLRVFDRCCRRPSAPVGGLCASGLCAGVEERYPHPHH